MWQLRQIKLARPLESVPLILSKMPLDGELPTMPWTSWQELHSISWFHNIAWSIDFPVRLLPAQVAGTGATMLALVPEVPG